MSRIMDILDLVVEYHNVYVFTSFMQFLVSA